MSTSEQKTVPDESVSHNYVDDRFRRLDATQVDVPVRILLGPGPSNAHPRVLSALGMRQVGHLDPCFLKLMDETQDLLRYAFQTSNKITIPISGTGSAAMESTFANLVEQDDVVLIGVAGYFGERMVDMASRYGAKVVRLDKPWGSYWSVGELEEAVKKHRPKILALVHADTSTGVSQPLEGVGQMCHEQSTLLLVDAVTSLGGLPLYVDRWGIDACYSGSQKCLSCPPGIAPVTFSDRAMEAIGKRRTPVSNWYLDMSMISKYWGKSRTYHHTAPINMAYALRESLRLVAEEGLERRWKRHERSAKMLWTGLHQLGLKLFIDEEARRLASLVAVRIPDGVDGKLVSRYMLQYYNIEIGGGLGELSGKIWRIGLMGFNSRAENVSLVLVALQDAVESTMLSMSIHTSESADLGAKTDVAATAASTNKSAGLKFRAAAEPVPASNMFAALPGSVLESLSAANLEGLWNHYDTDDSGNLDFTEVLVLVRHLFSEWLADLEKSSADDSGLIEALRSYLSSEDNVKSVAYNLIAQCDSDGDGKISCDGFIRNFPESLKCNMEGVVTTIQFLLSQ